MRSASPTDDSHFRFQWAILCAALIALGGSFAVYHFQEHQRIELQERQRLAIQAEIIEKNLVPQLLLANRVIEGIIGDLPSWQAEKDGFRGANRKLRVINNTLVGINPILVIRADGQVVASSNDKLVGMNFAQRDYFRTARDNPDPAILHVSAPFKTVLDTFVISLFRSIRGAHGEFAGIVIVSVVPEYFSILLDSVRYAPDMWTSIAHGDGKLFLIAPAQAGVLGTDLAKPGGFFLRHRESGRRTSLFEGRSQATGDQRMFALRTIQLANPPMDKSLEVAVTRSLDALFAPWRRSLYLQSGLFAVLAVLAVLALFIVQRRRGEQIVEREQAEARMLQQMQFSDDIINSLPGIFYMLDQQGRFIRVNQKFLEVSGYAQDELAAMCALDLFQGEDRNAIAGKMQEAFAAGDSSVEAELCVKSGAAIPYYFTGRRTSIGDQHYLVGIGTDIAERKAQEEQRRQVTLEMETILGNAMVGIAYLKQRRIVSCNRRLEEIFGYGPNELIGESTEQFYDTRQTFLGVGERAYIDLDKQNNYDEELRLRKKDGSLFWGALTGCAIDPARPNDGSIWIYSDISARKQAELALQESRERFDLAVRGTADGIWDWNIESGETYVSERWCEMLGYRPGEVHFGAKGWSHWIHPEDREAALALMRQHLKFKTPYASEYRMATKRGEYRWFLNRGQAVWNAQGKAIRIAGSTSDITERKEAEAKLKLAANVFTYAREGITITDADANIMDVNETFTSITGYSREEVLGKNPRFLKSGRQGAEFYSAMWRSLSEKGHWYGEIWNRRKNGEIYPEMITISAVRDAQGITQQYVALFSDITQLKEHEQQLEHIAHFDALTTLPNRVLLADRLQQAMAQAQRRGQRLAVAYLDLDGFKPINDKHGHDAGDQLLVAIASRMKQTLRDGDTLARLGGDEFVAVLLDLADIQSSLPMLNRLLVAAAQPVQVGDLVLQVSASLGVTFYPQAEDMDADQLLRQSDQAMYQAKVAGKNRYHVFDAELDRSVRGHHESLERIGSALAEREFVLYYQPKVNMRSGKIIGAEALIRWRHPERGLLAPAIFLPVIEDHPLAVKLGEWVIDAALTQVEAWRGMGLDVPVSVNVGARQLQHGDFVERLALLLAAHPQIGPGDLELEVLETSALEDLARISAIIESCRGMGVKFALDDFGTGYSSLTYLKRLPVTLLKIDQSFVRDMLDDPDDLAILKGVLDLALAFHRQAIAEGVETVAHGTLLLQLGCELAQGFGIARPMPAQELPGWVADWRPDPEWLDLRPAIHEDIPLLFASVEHRAWVRAIEEHVKGERMHPPPLDLHQCQLGAWLDSQGQARFGSHAAFHAIGPLHCQIHMLAAELCQRHSGELDAELQARLGELHVIRDSLLEQLKALEREIRQ